jgi:hypothetical protein
MLPAKATRAHLLRVKCPTPLSDFNQIWIYSTHSTETLQYRLSRKSVQREPS